MLSRDGGQMKVAARTEIEIKCEVVGPPAVRIIDATLNSKGFEDRLTKSLEREIQRAGVTVRDVFYPKNPSDFFAALAAPGEFNVLLLVAHGQVAPTGCIAAIKAWFAKLLGRERALQVRVAGLLCPWQLLGAANAELTDKMVFLAVCGGLCPDSTWTWVTDQHLALLLVASRRSVTGNEVLGVFPRVLDDLKGHASISPEDLDAAVKKRNVKNAFEVFSGVGIL
jgi:hypothetical protein